MSDNEITQQFKTVDAQVMELQKNLTEVLGELKHYLKLPSIKTAHYKLESAIRLTKETLCSLQEAEKELK